ncbi:MAG: YdeI/OmpD-associated family protein [Bacteroidota bacterium]
MQWIGDAKTELTRENRIAAAVEWMAEGKVRNWKYVKK